ncbi:MAG: Rpn family recombination-promoting nuclease/putative transposase [Verrucomicrobia bacterium]|nr:Rpn family recombination-promoting nuclease/putative transposase [Verrucomicrobiota bacterium]
MPHYLDPKSDLVFKKVFGEHPNILKNFLNAILPLPQDCLIDNLEYLSPENVPEIEGMKHTIVDVRCYDNHGRHFIVEMQLQWAGYFIKRMVFNTAATYVRQFSRGEKYETLSPVYGLALIDDTFSEEEDWFHHYQLCNKKNKTLEDLQMILIELPKFKAESIAEKRLAVLWLRFFREINEKTKQVDESLLKETYINKALKLVETAAYTQEELLAYDKDWDAISCSKTIMDDRFNKGLTQGREEGKTEIILNMHRAGIPLDQIASFAKISLKEVEKLMNEN